jgi:hypothetical protein
MITLVMKTLKLKVVGPENDLVTYAFQWRPGIVYTNLGSTVTVLRPLIVTVTVLGGAVIVTGGAVCGNVHV